MKPLTGALFAAACAQCALAGLDARIVVPHLEDRAVTPLLPQKVTSTHKPSSSTHKSSSSTHKSSSSTHTSSTSTHKTSSSTHKATTTSTTTSSSSKSSSSSTKRTTSSSHTTASSSKRVSSSSSHPASVTTKPTTTTIPVASLGGGQSVTDTDDLLDPSYNAYTDDGVYLTVSGFPPNNGKTRPLTARTSGTSSGKSSSKAASSVRVVAPGNGDASMVTSTTPPAPTATTIYTAFATTIQSYSSPTGPPKLVSSFLAKATGTCPTVVGIKAAVTSATITWPAPSRSSVACTAAPTSFAGTGKGFQDLCAGVRYCDPPLVSGVKFNSLTGAVTRPEIEGLLGQLQNVGPVYEVGDTTNVFSTGWSGQAAYGSGLLFEVTGDRRALDNAVRISDNILALRNNNITGRVMWTGKRDLIWPTKSANGPYATYAGSENLSIIGNMVNAAIYIIQNPCLWGMKPQWVSGPTNFTTSSTYLDRALAYVAAADETMDTFFLPWFFNPQGLMIQPNTPLYNKARDFPAGTWMPWNRRSLMLHGLIRLATVHSLPGPLFNPKRQRLYDQLSAVNVRDFVNSLIPTHSRGYPTYTWYYANNPPGGTIEMVRGVHGFYDIWGLWIAWQRGVANDSLTTNVMKTFTNTMMYQIYSDDTSQLFAAYVNGYANLCNIDEQPIKYLWGAYAFFGQWNADWYTAVAAAGQAQYKLTWVTAPTLWAKAAMHCNTNDFWIGNYTRTSPLGTVNANNFC